MQGTVFGSIICTSVMDKLAKIFYKDPDLVYKFKNKVEVPVLGMVDDILCVSRCSSKTVISNATVNSFMELNRLTLVNSSWHLFFVSDNFFQTSRYDRSNL